MRLKYTFETMELDDQVVAVPVGEGAEAFHGVIRLNETGAFIFELLKNDMTERDIVDAMKKEYDASAESLTADIHRYIDEFKGKEILIL